MTTLLDAVDDRKSKVSGLFAGRMKAALEERWNASQGLTISLDSTKERLLMDGTRTLCAYQHCENTPSPKAGGGMCKKHYDRVRRTGETWPTGRKNERRKSGALFPMSPMAEARFLAKVVKMPVGCWVWTAVKNKAGYGMFKYDKLRSAHRVSYMHFVGPIPEGMVIDHLCRNRSCVNPEHLEAVTATTNWERGFGPALINREKTHCKHGHEFTPENTIPNSSGGRQCRTCSQKRIICAPCGRSMQVRSRAKHMREVHGGDAA